MIPLDKCYEIVKHHESCVLTAYKDIAGIWTIGWGTTRYESGATVKQGQTIPQWRADELLKVEVESKARSVNSVTRNVILKQCQFDSLVSFAYNVGVGAFQRSTMLKKILKNPNDPTIHDEFMRWNKARVNGVMKEVRGLTARRRSESWLYFNDEIKYFKG